MTFIDTVLHGDALIELRKLPDNSIDALVCDPPSSIHFMGKSWDSDKGGRKQWIAWLTDIMQEVYRVLKPGAHGLVWSLPRTSHWTGTALEDAGFEIRDCVYHVFGQGFPKSLDISKSIDKLYGEEREIVGVDYNFLRRNPHTAPIDTTYNKGHKDGIEAAQITAPATPEAVTWSGFGSALKPSCEQWWLIRKPLGESSIAKNVLKWGTGALNIDGCRIPGTDTTTRHNSSSSSYMTQSIGEVQPKQETYITGSTSGRFPSHLLLSHSLFCGEQCVPECPVAIMDAQSGTRKSGGRVSHTGEFQKRNITGNGTQTHEYTLHPSEGGASRYFAQFRPDAPFIYASKASRRERNAGCEALPERQQGKNQPSFEGGELLTGSGNKRSNYLQKNHPTVKSQQLMRYMLKLITPPNGVVLDCFAGSGSTLIAAIHENFHYIGIEQEAEYVEIINARINHAINEKHKDIA